MYLEYWKSQWLIVVACDRATSIEASHQSLTTIPFHRCGFHRKVITSHTRDRHYGYVLLLEANFLQVRVYSIFDFLETRAAIVNTRHIHLRNQNYHMLHTHGEG